MGGVLTLSLYFPMTLYKDLLLVEIGDTILGKNKPWGITYVTILVVVLGDAAIPDRLVDKW